MKRNITKGAKFSKNVDGVKKVFLSSAHRLRMRYISITVWKKYL